MEQRFFDAKTGKENKKKDSTGSLKARIEALEAKIRSMAGVPKPTPTPTDKPPAIRQKKVLDKKLNPDTGEMAQPGEPTISYDGSQGSGPSYHYDGLGNTGALPLGIPVSGTAARTQSPKLPSKI